MWKFCDVYICYEVRSHIGMQSSGAHDAAEYSAKDHAALHECCVGKGCQSCRCAQQNSCHQHNLAPQNSYKALLRQAAC